MWFKLAGADFSKNNLGTMSSISSSYLIDYTGLTGMSGSPSSVSYAGSSAGTSKTASIIVTVTSGYTFKSGSIITASGGATGTVFTADKDYTGGQTFTFSMAITANTKLTGVAEATGGSSSGGNTGGSEGNEPEVSGYTMLSEREYPDTYVNINATSKAGDSLEMIAKFTYGRQTDPTDKKQILCGSNMGVLMMIKPQTKVMTNNTNDGTYALTEGSEYYMKIKLVPSGSKSIMTSTVYSGTDTTLSTPLDTITRDITNTTEYPLYVGNSQVTTTTTLNATKNSGIKIKEFQVYKPSGTLIFNGVPAKRNSDNAYGLWDSVTQTFFAEEKIIIS